MLKARDASITEGPLFFKITKFAIPLMLTGILQMLYSMADNVVVGKFSGDPNALGAVGSTTSLNNLIIHLLLGLATGSSIVIAQAYGAKREREVSRAVHTAMTVSVFGGLLFMALGLAVSSPALSLMGTKEILMDNALLYMRIICIGIPATAIYNFGAAILRAIGDSKTPLIILSSSGLINVLLNLIFVIFCGMTVDGVAIATISSQYISAIAVTVVLFKKKNECYGLSRNKYCFDFILFKKILRFGIPSGIQSSMFGISNVLLTSGMNSFTSAAVIKAHTITTNIDGFAYTVCNAFCGAAMTFVGQNYGAMKLDRVKKSVLYSGAQAIIAGVTVGVIAITFLDGLASLYIDSGDPARDEILTYVNSIGTMLLSTYFLCGVMEVISASIKAIGYSVLPMIISLCGICGLRIVWIYCVFPYLGEYHTPAGLMFSYPVTWSATILMLSVLFIIAWRRIKRVESHHLKLSSIDKAKKEESSPV